MGLVISQIKGGEILPDNTTQSAIQSPQELIKQSYSVDFKKLARLIYTDLEAKDTSSIIFKSFSKKQVADALQNPQANEKFLRDLSKFLYVLSPHYKRLCDYYSDLPKFRWYISPLMFDKSKVKPDMMKLKYRKTLDYLTNMNIAHEFNKVNQIAFREGIFYGYKYETTDSFFIQKLDPDYCKITGIEDGCYNFAFNFAYFNNANTNINNFAPEFAELYAEYKRAKEDKNVQRKDLPKYQWRELDSKYSICIKADETIVYPFPPFIGVIPDVYDIQEYKNLKKASTKLQNTAILVGGIPLNNKSEIANDFLVDLDTAIDFGNKISESLPDQMAFLLSVYDDVQLLKMPSDTISSNKVEEAVQSFWESSGTSSGLFSGTASTDAAQDRSIATDEETVFRILRQMERWVNRNFKLHDYFNGSYKFNFRFLDVTNLNWKKVIEQELKVGQYGIPNKIRLCTSIGMLQSEVDDMAYLENELLGLDLIWKPLISSNTMSVESGDVGNPPANEDGSTVPTE
jgi:hypothetical protein